jgi:hypothetical protein
MCCVPGFPGQGFTVKHRGHGSRSNGKRFEETGASVYKSVDLKPTLKSGMRKEGKGAWARRTQVVIRSTGVLLNEFKEEERGMPWELS